MFDAKRIKENDIVELDWISSIDDEKTDDTIYDYKEVEEYIKNCINISFLDKKRLLKELEVIETGGESKWRTVVHDIKHKLSKKKC